MHIYYPLFHDCDIKRYYIVYIILAIMIAYIILSLIAPVITMDY